MKKRGLSDVITTVLIILLVIVSVAIIWAVFKNFISQSSSQIESGTFDTNIEIPAQSVIITNNEKPYVHFNIKRDSGESNIKSFQIVLEDKSGLTEVKRVDGSLKTFETFPIDFQTSKINDVKTISVIPIIANSEGKELESKITASYNVEKEGIAALPNAAPINTPDGGVLIQINTASGKNSAGYIPAGLFGYYRFDGDYKDSSGKGNDGVISGNVNLVDDSKFGKAASFAGGYSGSKVTINSVNGIGKTSISECLWVKFNSFNVESQLGYVYATGLSPGNNRFFYFSSWCPSGAPYSCMHEGVSTTSGTWDRGTVTSSVFQANQWYFACTVIDTSKAIGMVKVYLNGAKISSYDNINTGDISGTPTSIYLGERTEDASSHDGIFDEVMLFNRALSDDEVSSLYSMYR